MLLPMNGVENIDYLHMLKMNNNRHTQNRQKSTQKKKTKEKTHANQLLA